jgi:hypothetical protein
LELFREVQKSFVEADFRKALTGLDTWSERFPRTDFEGERQFQYIQAYNGTAQPAKVLEVAGTVMTKGLPATLPDPRQALTMLYLASLNVQKIQRPNRAQMATAQEAARELLRRLPDFFAPGSRPANTTEAQWRKLHDDLETVANGALAPAEHHRALR